MSAPVKCHFRGEAWLTYKAGPGNLTDCLVSDVTFAPGSRNHWHTHGNGQILIGTQGCGLYQEVEKPGRLIRPGDTVVIPPNVLHWHGAISDTLFTHMAINPNASSHLCEWGRPVSEQEYKQAHQDAGLSTPTTNATQRLF